VDCLGSLRPLIRTARVDDSGAICRLLAELDRHMLAICPEIFQPVEHPEAAKEQIEEGIRSGDRTYLLAELEGSVVGFAAVRVALPPELPAFRPTAYLMLDYLIVSEPYRGKRIGQQLVEAARAWGRERDLSRVEVQVYAVNAGAVDFYRRSGFQPLHQRLAADLSPEALPKSHA
jgi:diamine N-acetyltransferase